MTRQSASKGVVDVHEVVNALASLAVLMQAFVVSFQ